jgi:hypothetical protein
MSSGYRAFSPVMAPSVLRYHRVTARRACAAVSGMSRTAGTARCGASACSIGVLARCPAAPEPGEHGREVITAGSACRLDRGRVVLIMVACDRAAAARCRVRGVRARDQVIAELGRAVAELRAEVAELRRRPGRNSRNSSMPPSSDDLPGHGKQPGAPGTAMSWAEPMRWPVTVRPGPARAAARALPGRRQGAFGGPPGGKCRTPRCPSARTCAPWPSTWSSSSMCRSGGARGDLRRDRRAGLGGLHTLLPGPRSRGDRGRGQAGQDADHRRVRGRVR